MKAIIKTEIPKVLVVPDDELRMRSKTDTATPVKSEPTQEGRPVDVDKFDRLCCLGDELACQRLGSKHHRTNTRCWTHPKTCYHCDLIASVDSKTKLLYMTSVQVQLGTIKASSSLVNVKSLSKARSVNGQSFCTNRRTRSKRVRQSEVMPELDTPGRLRKVCHIKPDEDTEMRNITRGIINPDFYMRSNPNRLVRSIEDYVPAATGAAEFAGRDESYGRDRFDCEQYHRSQAPSPELQTRADFCNNDEELPASRATSAVKRDFRYELGFLMNLIA